MLPASDPATAIVPIDGNKPPLPSSTPKGKQKKGGAMSFLRAALFMLKSGGTGKKSKPSFQIEVAAASADMINKVVGSMRPLHAQGGESPVHFARIERAESPVLYPPSPSMSELYEDVSQSPYSVSSSPFRARIHASPSTSSLTSEGTCSRFASALNLLDLDNHSDHEESDDDVDSKLEAAPEDEMIDSKAEEFISRFYEQMVIQNHTEKLRRSGCQKY